MPRPAPLALLMRLIAAMMLATVGIHAAAPASQPMERVQGSAFSAATDNVSLKNGHKAPAASALTIEPADVGTSMALARHSIGALASPLRSFDAQGPPLPVRLIRAAPREPPAA